MVHGADYFNEAAARITEDVIQSIKKLADLAPLRNESALAVIRATQSKVGPQLPMFAVFDTVFDRAIPDEAALHPLPLDLAQRHKSAATAFMASRINT